MKHGKLHPSINVEEIRIPEIDLDVCANEAVDHEIQHHAQELVRVRRAQLLRAVSSRFDPKSSL